MQELYPVMAGALVGAVVMFVPILWLRTLLFVVGCILAGLSASFISGELEESWDFLSVDMLLAWVGGLIAVGIVSGIRHRAEIARFFSGSQNKR